MYYFNALIISIGGNNKIVAHKCSANTAEYCDVQPGPALVLIGTGGAQNDCWLIVPPCCKNRVVFLSLNKLGDSRGRRTAYLQQRPLSFPLLTHLSVHIHLQCCCGFAETQYTATVWTKTLLMLCWCCDDSF